MTPSGNTKRRLAAIMFADIMGYTALMQADEEHALRLRDRHRDVVGSCMDKYNGEVVQYYGDGVLCLFHSAKEAVLAGQEIQRLLRSEPSVPLRVGIHMGDVVQDASGVYGDCVNIASRIESLAIRGSVLYSDKVQNELANHPGIKSVALGTFELKNVSRPVGVYALDSSDVCIPAADAVGSLVAKRHGKNIAVIPFASLDSSDEGGYFADGVSEEIMNGLSKVEGIAMISRATCQAIKGHGEDALRFGRSLGVSHFLEGSVRKAGMQVRVNVALVNTADGYQVWSEKYDGSLANMFELQDEIARKVANAVRVNFDLPGTPAAIIAPQTLQPEAHNYYLKGLHLWNRNTPDSVMKAIDFFDHALEVDSGYSSAECALSHCYAYLGSCGAYPPTEAYAKALNHAMSAIEHNPANAEAHLAIANLKFHHYWDWEGTRASLDKARALGLNTGLMHQTDGLFHAAMGDHQEGISRMQQALQHDPMSIPVMAMLGTLYLFNEQYSRAIEVYDEVIELEPSYRSALLYKGVTLVCEGRLSEAIDLFAKYHEMVNHPQRGIAGLIIGHYRLGNMDISQEYLDRLYARRETETSAAVDIDLAIVHAGTGDYDRAMDFLSSVYEKRFSIACMGVIWIIRCPLFKGLWETSRFRELMHKMGLRTMNDG